jgi:predicted phage baseplate assembly protein
VLVDHGLTISSEPLVFPYAVPSLGNYLPQLVQTGLTFQGPLDLKSATAAMQWDVHKARPDVRANGEGRTWSPQLDLLASDKSRDEFVVEMESDGVAHLRFGDGILGRKPQPGAQFTATYRVGNGPAGNVGAEVLTRVVFAHPAITSVRNPLPATGGAAAEAFEQVRQFAPQAFRRQERAVTAADYASMAERHPGIQKAAARFRWTGSWYTAFVAIDRTGGLEVNDVFRQEMADFLERYRLAGYDVEIAGAVYVPLDVAMIVCLKPGYFRANMKKELLEAFSNRELPDGRRGFFHPDSFTFGQSVYLSALYETAMSVAGVASVVVTRFQRWGKLANKELDNAVLTPGEFEIVRLDNDRNFPENGKLEFTMGGGM